MVGLHPTDGPGPRTDPDNYQRVHQTDGPGTRTDGQVGLDPTTDGPGGPGPDRIMTRTGAGVHPTDGPWCGSSAGASRCQTAAGRSRARGEDTADECPIEDTTLTRSQKLQPPVGAGDVLAARADHGPGPDNDSEPPRPDQP